MNLFERLGWSFAATFARPPSRKNLEVDRGGLRPLRGGVSWYSMDGIESDYQFKRQPRQHQLVPFNRFKDAEFFALFMEMRTGKTLVALTIACHRYELGDIDALLVVAPNGVHRDWVFDHVPLDVPDRISHRCFAWSAAKASSTETQKQLKLLLNFDGLSILAMNPEALSRSVPARGFVSKFVRRRRAMIVVDESDLCKTPGSKITRTMGGLRQHGVVRAILTGTPVASGPLDLYGQFRFLNPATLGFDSYFAYKSFYAEFEERRTHGGQSYPILKRYRNLEDLTRKLEPVSFRVTRAECGVDLPKSYSKRRFDLTPTQRRVYDDLRLRYVAELLSGDVVTAAHVLSRWTRLQQVTSNQLPVESEPRPCVVCEGRDPDCAECLGYGFVIKLAQQRVIDPDRDPRYEELVSELELSDQPTVIWCRFRMDVEAALRASKATGRRAVRYDGSVGVDDRRTALVEFQEGRADDFVANLGVRRGGRGLRLARPGGRIIYYSNVSSLRVRDQSEDRMESLEMTEATTIIDIIATDTVDERIVQLLRERKTLSDLILGDDVKEWI